MVRKFMLTQTFICKSAYVRYNPMYVSVAILCTNVNATTVTEISQ